jgi:hypothetical protein
MQLHNVNNPSVGVMVFILVFINAVILKVAFIVEEDLYWLLVVTLPLLALAVFSSRKSTRRVEQKYLRIGIRRVITRKQKARVKTVFVEQL